MARRAKQQNSQGDEAEECPVYARHIDLAADARGRMADGEARQEAELNCLAGQGERAVMTAWLAMMVASVASTTIGIRAHAG